MRLIIKEKPNLRLQNWIHYIKALTLNRNSFRLCLKAYRFLNNVLSHHLYFDHRHNYIRNTSGRFPRII